MIFKEQTDLSLVLSVLVVSIFLVLSLTTATAIFVLCRIKLRRNSKDIEIEKDMKQDLNDKLR